MAPSVIRTTWRGPSQAVLVVTIDRPERRNAVDLQALHDLRVALDEAAEAPARVVVLTGEGGAFCAGADLTGLEDAGFADVLGGVLRGFGSLPAATIAAVEGPALGAGTQLALACDLRVATPDARFGVPAARLGLMVDAWTVHRLVALAGGGPARALLVGADTLTGERAHELGLVQRLGTVADAVAWADELAELAPLTIFGHKVGLERLDGSVEGEQSYRFAFERAWRSADLREGLSAFREKRPARFEGR